MGTSLTGREILVGLKKAGTWRTAVACGAGDGILVLSETFKQTLEHLDDDSAGLPFIQRTDPGKTEASGGMEMYMRYEGLDLLLALIMGTAGVPSTPNVLYTTLRANTYSMDTDPAGMFATLAMLKKSDKVFEHPSVKFNQFSLTGEMNTPVKLSVEGIANKLEKASEINTALTLAGLTYPDKGNRIIFNSSTRFWINNESGDALDSDDAVSPSGFSISFNRPSDADLVAGSATVEEPVGSGFPEMELTLNFPRYNDANAAFFTNWEAFTRKKLEILFRGTVFAAPDAPDDWGANAAFSADDCVKPTVANGLWYVCTDAGTSHADTEPTWPTTVGETVSDGTVEWTCMEDVYYYEFKLSFPNLKVIDPDAAISGPGAIPVSLSFKVLGTDSAPTGMTGITEPFQIDVQNTLTTDPLAVEE